MAQGLEESRNCQGGDNDGDVRRLVDKPPEEVLQGKDETKVDQDENASE